MALLDETDIEILHSLQKDAKINTKELSEKLHISKTPIYERIKRLENEGYIKDMWHWSTIKNRITLDHFL